LLPFCPEGGGAITCAGPNAEVIWQAKGRDITPAEQAAFKEAYCAPGVCVTGSKIAPPAGVTERIIAVKPRNPAVAIKASCQPHPQPGPVVMDTPVVGPPGPVPVQVVYTFARFTTGCIRMSCGVGASFREVIFKSYVPFEVLEAWRLANCGPG
jgi:hypothetical protein